LVKDANGKALTTTIGITFLLYKDQQGGAPLWMETQNVQPDATGRYSLQLGATKSGGLPTDMFTSGEARWLGVQVQGQTEHPRVLLLSVPYALKAADAETLGGKPLSAFQLAAPQSKNSSTQKTQPPAEQPNEISCAGGAACKASFIPRFSSNGGSAKVNNSVISQSGTNIAIAGSENVSGNINSGGNLSASGNVSANGNIGASTMTAGASGNVVVATMSGNTAQTAAVTGVATATGVGNTYGVAGYSSTGNGVGVFGQDNSGIGLYGSGNVAIWGESSGISGGSDGVHGVAHGPASGVAGVNTDPSGVGVWGQSPGWSFYSAGNVSQDRGSGGWAKAMVYVNGQDSPYSIIRCFNSTLMGAAATTPPCGFNLSELQIGWFTLDFGFEVDDRFLSATIAGSLLTDFISVCTSDFCTWLPDNHTVSITTLDTNINLHGRYFHLIVY
jgi:hypothetical protein